MKPPLLLLIPAILLVAIGFYLGFTLQPGQEVRTVIDNTAERFYTVHTDTTFVEGPDRLIKGQPGDSILQTVYLPGDTVQVRGETVIVEAEQEIRTYSEAIQDTSLTGTFSATVEGNLLDWDLNYRINYPMVTVTERDSIVVTIRERETPNRFFGGASATSILTREGVGVVVGPYAGVRLGRNAALSYGYGVPVFGDIPAAHIVTLSVGL